MNKKGKSIIIFGIIFLFIITLFSIIVIAGDVGTKDVTGDIIWARTASTETIKHPDGTMTTTIFSGATFIDDKTKRQPNYVPWNSSFFPIINSNYKDYEYQLDTNYSKYEAYFQNDIKAGKGFRFEVNDYWFTYDLSGGKIQWNNELGQTKAIGAILSSSPYIFNNNTIRYNNSFKYTDVQYEMNLEGVKENFILSNLSTLDWKNKDTYLEYTGELQFDNNLTIWANGEPKTSKAFTTSREIEFKDSNNVTIFKMPSPIAEDSNGKMVSLIYDIKPNTEKLTFGLKIPVSFLNSAVYPVFIDPTITLQTANTENLKDAYVISSSPDSNMGTQGNLIGAGNPGYVNYISFSLPFTSDIIINMANLSLYAYQRDVSGTDNVSVNHVYNDWASTNGTKMNLSETQLTWNNQPCGTSFTNSTNCNLTQNNVSVSGTGFFNWNISYSLKNDYNLKKNNISYAFTMFAPWDGSTIDFASKEYSTASLRPKLTITYTPYIDILSPTPSQIFTEDIPTARFNISTAINMDKCFYELDGTNRTMNSKNATSFNITNTTMTDGSHFVRFWCNETSTGTWRQSDNISFDVDSVNITTCRDLTVGNRTYNLLNNISGTINYGHCIGILNSSIIFNGNNKNINKSVSYFTIYGMANPTDNLRFNNLNLTGYLTITQEVYVASGINNSIYDSNLGGGTIFTGWGDLNLTNVTNFEQDITGILRVKWYFDYKVNSSSGNIQDAIVEIYDKDNNLIYSPLTNSTGQISQLQLIEYISNGGTKTYSSPYTVNVSKTNYLTNSTVYNLTTLNNMNKYVTLSLSNQAPVSTLNSPANDSWSQTALNSFNCSQTDNEGLSNVTLTLWKGATIYANTSIITGFSNSTILNRSLTDGTWLWNCLVYDNSSTSSWATNRTINVDTTNPLISYGNNNELNNTNFSRSWIYVNTSITEANFNNITFYLYNSSKVLLTSYTYTSLTSFQNFTSLADGTYYYNVTIFDKSSRTNSTGTMNITIDDTSPLVNIIYPINLNSYSNGTNFQINYTVSDNLIGLDKCWYNSGATNTTITCGNNITVSLSNGAHTYTIYSNDTLNNLGSDSVTFTISTVSPSISLNYPTNNQYVNTKTNVYFNFTATDSDGLSTCQLWTNTTGSWLKNYTWISPSSGVTNFTRLNLTDGFYKYGVWCNDTIGNGDSSNNFTFTIDTINPSVVDNSYYPSTIYNETEITIYGNVSDINLYKIWIEINSTLVYQNITVTSHTGDTYVYPISSSETNNHQNISWKWWSNDSAGNQNVSKLNYFVITNRAPVNLTVYPINNSFINTDYLIINFTANDSDFDTLNYSIFYSNGTLFNSTISNSTNFTGFNTTDQAVNLFYVNVSDGYLTNQSNYTFTIDKTSPNLTLNKPEASPFLQCSLSSVYLNISTNDTNLDYCSLNVTYGSLVSTANTIFNCSNTNFAVTFDNSVQLLSVSSFDKSGNVNTTTRYLYFNSGHSSCASVPPSVGGSGGSEPVDYGYCGDKICQDGTNGTIDRGEDFYGCAEDCTRLTLTFENFNLETALTNCISKDTVLQEKCLWKTSPGLLTLLIVILAFFLFALFFSIKSNDKGVKKIIYNNKFFKKKRRY